MHQNESATLEALKTHRSEVIDPVITRHSGRVVKVMGDGVLVEFASVVDAVNCAIGIQRGMAERNQDIHEDQRIDFRIGINLGDVLIEGEDIFGDGVNIAARLEGMAQPGGICVSDVVRQITKARIDVPFDDLGEQTVKNIAQPIRIWQWSDVSRKSDGRTTVATGREPLAIPEHPSIAVLPFDNLSGDPEQDYFSDGMTEDLITDLSKLSGLLVIARNSVFAYKQRTAKPQDVAAELGVRYVLEGSLRRAGQRIRINAQLLDAASGFHLWAERYDREINDIFALQDEITRHIVDALKVRLTLREADSLTYRDTDNVEAFDLFLQAKDFQLQRTKNGLAKARQALEAAIELDPNFASAVALLAHIYQTEWIFGWGTGAQTLGQALALAKRAVNLNENLPLARLMLGWIHLWLKNYDQALHDTEHAVQMDPNYAEGFARFGHVLDLAGRPQDGLGLIERALRLDPHSFLYLFYLGHAQASMQYDCDAVATLRRSATINADYISTRQLLAACLANLGRMDEAHAEGAEVLRIDPHFSITRWAKVLPYRDRQVLERHINGLRVLGLPE